ncbi:hypothetical protein LQ327_00355 [Actinomycetospora endophytica]|uniref:Uncharacterized protein n=1 Tax=Actinomycetospora endophytica TaxID=2291215 RepID=A0ABS8P1H5_9PSEU|nr:hypothetical protein [Actinomycetospora endophytica]MCD2191842.1 hypothetical protein [Actinomycetospora endophytica]
MLVERQPIVHAVQHGRRAESEPDEREPRSRGAVARRQAQEVPGYSGPQRVVDGIGEYTPHRHHRRGNLAFHHLYHGLGTTEDQATDRAEEQHVPGDHLAAAGQVEHDRDRQHPGELSRDTQRRGLGSGAAAVVGVRVAAGGSGVDQIIEPGAPAGWLFGSA